MEKEFYISHYPLERSKFLYDMYQCKNKFGGEINKYFDYTLFHYRVGEKFQVKTCGYFYWSNIPTNNYISNVTLLYVNYVTWFEPYQRTVRIFYDILHGIKQNDVNLGEALELGILIGFDGQLEQNSEMEKSILQCVLSGLHQAKLDRKERALVWLYVKTWDAYGKHLIDYNKYFSNYDISRSRKWRGLWSFDYDDLEEALISISYPKKETRRKDRLNSWN